MAFDQACFGDTAVSWDAEAGKVEAGPAVAATQVASIKWAGSAAESKEAPVQDEDRVATPEEIEEAIKAHGGFLSDLNIAHRDLFGSIPWSARLMKASHVAELIRLRERR